MAAPKRKGGRTCKACVHPKRADLDRRLASGEGNRATSRHFPTLSKDALRRHRPHVSKAIVKAAERAGEQAGDTILARVHSIEADVTRLRELAEDGGDFRAALVACDRLLDVVRLLLEMKKAGAGEDPDRVIRIEYPNDWRAGPSVETVYTKPAAEPA